MAKRNLKVESNNVIKVTAEKDMLWDMMLHNMQTIGGKLFGYVPLDALYLDERIQREQNKRKVNWLAQNWDKNLMEPLKVSMHPEEKRCSVINGGHRLLAMQLLGITGAEVEFVQGLPEDPEERLIAEAAIFARQGEGTTNLTPPHKHNANVLRGVPENVAVEKLVKKYNIELKPNLAARGIKNVTGMLTGFQAALDIAKVCGEEALDRTLYIICEARWNLAVNGLGREVLIVTNNVMRLHPTYKKEIADLLIHKYKEITPAQLFAEAHTKYPLRKAAERQLMYVEDIVCEELGITRTYDGGNLQSTLARIKVA